MAIAALAAPALLEQMTPEKALEFLEAAEKAAAKARSLAIKATHTAGLTEDERNEGWLPLMVLMYRLWQTVIGPQVEFGIQTQIGTAQVLNRFGANIDTSGLAKVLEKVQRVRAPFKKPAQGSNTPTTGIWEVGVL